MNFILFSKNTFGKLLEYEVVRFLMIGGTTVLIDLVIYFILIYIDFDTSFSKGISFSIGTIFAYFGNRIYTFQSSVNGYSKFIVFTLLYLTTLIINVVSNEIVLNLTSHIKFSLLIAFFIATSISAILNFIGMKYIVFNKKNY